MDAAGGADVPAGDIGVGKREVGYLFGQYKRLRNEFTGVLTGKAPDWGGSMIRPEATGYGCVYFAQAMLGTRDEDFQGKTCTVSGSGNVAQNLTAKLLDLGAKVVTMSDSGGFIHDPDGFDKEKLNYIRKLKNFERGRIREYVDKFKGATFTADARPWSVKCECAFPCATQNEINAADAKLLIENGCCLVSEGANMPSEPDAIELFLEHDVLLGPGKAANAGGVAVSGLEMAQNAMRLAWTSEEVDDRLKRIMKDIHDNAADAAEEYATKGNYVAGANIAGFRKVADAMLDQGVV